MTVRPAIRVTGLRIGWGETVLLRNLNFEVAEQDRFVILGGSGCGKSTLLQHLVGLQEPQAGAIDIAGIGPPQAEVGPPRFGVMFQSGALFGSQTLLENVALPLQRWTSLSPAAVRAVGLSRLRLVGLEGFENRLPAEISGGMKKRAGIARALALEPKLLFLDEPSAGLDPITAVELDDLLITLNEVLGVTIVLVTHELESIFKVGTNCIVLDKETQGILAHGDPRKLRDTSDIPFVRAFFHREAQVSGQINGRDDA
ncbi:MAG: ATP-binding cassette domain-containing protein [Planctomycetota bacterium]